MSPRHPGPCAKDSAEAPAVGTIVIGRKRADLRPAVLAGRVPLEALGLLTEGGWRQPPESRSGRRARGDSGPVVAGAAPEEAVRRGKGGHHVVLVKQRKARQVPSRGGVGALQKCLRNPGTIVRRVHSGVDGKGLR